MWSLWSAKPEERSGGPCRRVATGRATRPRRCRDDVRGSTGTRKYPSRARSGGMPALRARSRHFRWNHRARQQLDQSVLRSGVMPARRPWTAKINRAARSQPHRHSWPWAARPPKRRSPRRHRIQVVSRAARADRDRGRRYAQRQCARSATPSRRPRARSGARNLAAANRRARISMRSPRMPRIGGRSSWSTRRRAPPATFGRAPGGPETSARYPPNRAPAVRRPTAAMRATRATGVA